MRSMRSVGGGWRAREQAEGESGSSEGRLFSQSWFSHSVNCSSRFISLRFTPWAGNLNTGKREMDPAHLDWELLSTREQFPVSSEKRIDDCTPDACYHRMIPRMTLEEAETIRSEGMILNHNLGIKQRGKEWHQKNYEWQERTRGRGEEARETTEQGRG